MRIWVVKKVSKNGNVYYCFRCELELDGEIVYKDIPILDNDLLLRSALKRCAVEGND